MQRRNDRNSSRDDLQFRRDNSAWGGGRRATSREFDRRDNRDNNDINDRSNYYRGGETGSDYRAGDHRNEFSSDANFGSDSNRYQSPGDYRSTDFNRTTNYADYRDRAFGPSRDYIDNGRIEMGRPRDEENMNYGSDRMNVNDSGSRQGRYGQDFYGKGREGFSNENFSSASGSGSGSFGQGYGSNYGGSSYGMGMSSGSYGSGFGSGDTRRGYEQQDRGQSRDFGGQRSQGYSQLGQENYGGRDSWNSDRYSERRFGGGLSHYGKGPKGYQRSEERIKEEVCDILTHDHRVDASNIEVSIENGVVVLKGTVDDRQSKRLAEEAIENVQGVADVRNELKVQSSGMVNQNDTMSDLSTSSSNKSSSDKSTASATPGSDNKTWSEAGKIKGAKESVKSSDDKRLM